MALHRTVPDSGLTLLLDREQVEKIIANLLSNALKFTDPGDRIDLSVEATAGEARVRVADTGPGIAPEKLPHIFDRFYQVDTSATRARGGMGIGLALARELATLHGGTIEVENTLGEGAVFNLRLPLRPPSGGDSETTPLSKDPIVQSECGLADPKAAHPAAGPADRGDPHGRVVLVVDDNQDLRVYIRQVLEREYRVLEAADGEVGLSLARKALPDLIVADVRMPRMDGFAMARALGEEPLTGGIPLLYLTARAGEQDELEGFAAGAVAYVTKPFSSRTLLARVKALLRQQERLRDRLQAEHASGTTRQLVKSGGEAPLERKLRQAIEPHLHDESFGVEQLARLVGSSRPALFQKLKQESGASPSELLRRIRLEHASRLLQEGAGTVSEVAYAVGFATLAGFSRAYKRHFGVSPTTHLSRR